MSEGGFDVDALIRKRRNSENFFGVVNDPRTGRIVSYPWIPKNPALSTTKNRRTSRQNDFDEKERRINVGATSIPKDRGSSADSNGKTKTKYTHCQTCKEAYRCKLEEQGFIELCPFQCCK